MDQRIKELFEPDEEIKFHQFMGYLNDYGKKFFKHKDIMFSYEEFCSTHNVDSEKCKKSILRKFIGKIQEAFVQENSLVILHRYDMAKFRFYIYRISGKYMEEIEKTEYLDLKDFHITKHIPISKNNARISFRPFYDYYPVIRDSNSIGNGIRFLNRYLCSHIFQMSSEWNHKLYKFVTLHSYHGRQLLVNPAILNDSRSFYHGVEDMIEWLKTREPEEPVANVESKMRQKGFEAGWGDSVGRIIKNMDRLIGLISEPNHELLEEFISSVPMPCISKIVIVSPHGWFGQENVLGKPDTGGQVIYILDQVRALEKYLREKSKLTGLQTNPQIIVLTRLIPEAGNTTCNQRKEKIHGTYNSYILRIPFKDDQLNVKREWISRFKVWPYLERFADDAAIEITSEMGGRPDLIIGNYSDGNLVATLLSDKLDVIQCTIAHALEKTKYESSDVHWQLYEHDYNFSMQFTADMLAMNKTDFIVTSTKQEIYGTENSMGQYESYQFFSMPGLYQVTSGINLFAPKFNVIPPGVDENAYFSYSEKDKRIEKDTEKLYARVFSDTTDDIYGDLEDKEKPAIFTMARFDKIKNITGLIEAFGMSDKIKENFNLIFAAGTTKIEESGDKEEQEEIRKAYELIEKYKLNGIVRWLPSIEKKDTGEVYRIIAEAKGIFVQPAIFEAFGLTILESMQSGLPTFGPIYGGPLEIIENKISGYLLDTSKPELIAAGIEEYIDDAAKDPDLWEKLSENGIKRVQENFTWKLYSKKLIDLTKLYGFWRFSVSNKEKIKMDRYSDLLYHFLIREKTKDIKD